MTKGQLFKIIYWTIASVLIAILLQNSIPNFWDAWLIALFFLPAALMVKFGIDKTKYKTGIKKLIRVFFIAISSLYWGYLALTVAYWYFLELNADSIDKVLISPIFIWLIIGFFVLLEFIIFKNPTKDGYKSITIYSNRKRTTIKVDNLAYIESRGDFTVAVLIDGSMYKNTIKISTWEQKLQSFLRIHRSFLVNPDLSTINGNEIVVNAQWNLTISRSYKKKVIDYFNSYALS